MTRNGASAIGFTYVEVLLAVVILALTAASASYALVSSRRARFDSHEFDIARYLLQDGRVWAQILQRIEPDQVVTFGPESGETRGTFDDLDDLAGFTESPVIDRAAAAFSEYGRTFTLESMDLAAPDVVVSPGSSALVRLTIVVSRNGEELTRESLFFWRGL